MAEKKKGAADKIPAAAVHASPPAKAKKKGKLLKTKTHRLPRKQKKAQQKIANASS